MFYYHCLFIAPTIFPILQPSRLYERCTNIRSFGRSISGLMIPSHDVQCARVTTRNSIRSSWERLFWVDTRLVVMNQPSSWAVGTTILLYQLYSVKNYAIYAFDRFLFCSEYMAAVAFCVKFFSIFRFYEKQCYNNSSSTELDLLCISKQYNWSTQTWQNKQTYCSSWWFTDHTAWISQHSLGRSPL